MTSTDQPTGGMSHAMRAFRHREYRLFWGAALISNAGQWLQNITIPYVLFDLTGRESWVGLATFVQFIPGVLLGPAGGALADRFERRRVLFFTQLGAAFMALLLWAYWVSGGRSGSCHPGVHRRGRPVQRVEHPELAGVRPLPRAP